MRDTSFIVKLSCSGDDKLKHFLAPADAIKYAERELAEDRADYAEIYAVESSDTRTALELYKQERVPPIKIIAHPTTEKERDAAKEKEWNENEQNGTLIDWLSQKLIT